MGAVWVSRPKLPIGMEQGYLVSRPKLPIGMEPGIFHQGLSCLWGWHQGDLGARPELP